MLLLAPIVLGLSFFRPVSSAEITPTLDDCITDDLGLAVTYPILFTPITNYCAMQFNQGQLINRLEVWSSDHHVRGFRVHYTNGDTTTIGTQTNDYHDLIWDVNQVSILRAIGQQAGEESGLYIKLTDGRDLKAGVPSNWKDDNAGTQSHGALIGLGAKFDDDKPWIKAITIQTLKETSTNSRIHDVVFHPSVDELNGRSTNADRGLDPQALKNGHYFNDRGTDPITIGFEGREMVETSKSWTTTTANDFHLGYKTEIGSEIGGIAAKVDWKIGSDLFWEHHNETSTLQGESKQDWLVYNVQTVVKPGQAVHVWAWSIKGNMKVDYTAQMTVTWSNGKELTFGTAGTLDQISYSDAWVHVEDETIEAAQAAINSGDGTRIDGNGVVMRKRAVERSFVA
ncbi:hypothetical protein BU16DRAFT_355726 [Lophium mytilinum]|uniref:Jacalin-type lectin domain-containing protein n=1 Tax=Lophium mytilinum TaxID=390894 RepID=A0A6A6R1L4_9PEZI|nr:hypothetical protein BU16DRAFT_355726 [Lophium mytilinum]